MSGSGCRNRRHPRYRRTRARPPRLLPFLRQPIHRAACGRASRLKLPKIRGPRALIVRWCHNELRQRVADDSDRNVRHLHGWILLVLPMVERENPAVRFTVAAAIPRLQRSGGRSAGALFACGPGQGNARSNAGRQMAGRLRSMVGALACASKTGVARQNRQPAAAAMDWAIRVQIHRASQIQHSRSTGAVRNGYLRNPRRFPQIRRPPRGGSFVLVGQSLLAVLDDFANASRDRQEPVPLFARDTICAP